MTSKVSYICACLCIGLAIFSHILGNEWHMQAFIAFFLMLVAIYHKIDT